MARYKYEIGIMALLLLASCAPRRLPVGANSCANAPVQLRDAWNALQDAQGTARGCSGEDAARCEQLRLDIERLGQNCPAGEQTLLANAILAYDGRQLAKAQQYLDNLLASPRPNAEAAALRARIAMEEGNLPFALRFLAGQVRLNGDHSGLREVNASALYLSGDYAGASQELGIAERLGAPTWRVEYGKGLVAEASKNLGDAQRHFAAALSARPGWQLPAARIRALEARLEKK